MIGPPSNRKKSQRFNRFARFRRAIRLSRKQKQQQQPNEASDVYIPANASATSPESSKSEKSKSNEKLVADSHSQFQEDVSFHNLIQPLVESPSKDEPKSSIQPQSKPSLEDVSEGSYQPQLQLHEEEPFHNLTHSLVESPPKDEPKMISIQLQSEPSLEDVSEGSYQAPLQFHKEEPFHNLTHSLVESPSKDEPKMSSIQLQSEPSLEDVSEGFCQAQLQFHEEEPFHNLTHSLVESPPKDEPESSSQPQSEPSVKDVSEESYQAQLQFSEEEPFHNLIQPLVESPPKDEPKNSIQPQFKPSLENVSGGSYQAQLQVHEEESSHNLTHSLVESPPKDEHESSSQPQSEPSLENVSGGSYQAQLQVHEEESSHNLTHSLVESPPKDEHESSIQAQSEPSLKDASERSYQAQLQVHDITEQAQDNDPPFDGMFMSGERVNQLDEEHDFDLTFVTMLTDFKSAAVSIDVSDLDIGMESILNQISKSQNQPNQEDAFSVVPIPNPNLHAPPMQMTVQPALSPLDVQNVPEYGERFHIELPLSSGLENSQSQDEIFTSGGKGIEPPNVGYDSDLTMVTMLSDFESIAESIDVSHPDIDLQLVLNQISDLENQCTQDNAPVAIISPDLNAPNPPITTQTTPSSIDVRDNAEQFDIELLQLSSSENVESQDDSSASDQSLNSGKGIDQPKEGCDFDQTCVTMQPSFDSTVKSIDVSDLEFDFGFILNQISKEHATFSISNRNFNVPPLQMTAQTALSSIDVPENEENFNIPLNSSSENVQSKNKIPSNPNPDFHATRLKIIADPASSSLDAPRVLKNAEHFNIEIPLNSSSDIVQSQHEISPTPDPHFHALHLQIINDPASNSAHAPDIPENAEQFDIELPLNSSSENVQSQEEILPNPSPQFHAPPLQIMDDPASSFTDVSDMPENAEHFNIKLPLNSSSENVQSQHEISPNMSPNFHAPPLQVMDDPASSCTDVPDMPTDAEHFNIKTPLDSSSENVQSQHEISQNPSPQLHAPSLQIIDDPASSFTDVHDMPKDAEHFNIKTPLDSSSENVQSQHEISQNPSPQLHTPSLQIIDDPASSFTDVHDMPKDAEHFNIKLPLNSSSENVQSQHEISPNMSPNFHAPPLEVMDGPASSFTDVHDMPENAEQFNIKLPLNSSSENIESQEDISISDEIPSPEIHAPPLQMTAQPASSSFDVSDVPEHSERFNFEVTLNPSSEKIQSQVEKSISDENQGFGKRIGQNNEGCDSGLSFVTMQSNFESTAESTNVSDLNFDMESLFNQNSKSNNQFTKIDASTSYPSADLHAPPWQMMAHSWQIMAPPWQMMAHSVSNSFEIAAVPKNAVQFDTELSLNSRSETQQFSDLCSDLIEEPNVSILRPAMPPVPPLALESISGDNIGPPTSLEYDSATDLDMESETDTIVDSEEDSFMDDSSSTIIMTSRLQTEQTQEDMKFMIQTPEVHESIQENSYSLESPVSDKTQDTGFMAQTTKMQGLIEDNSYSLISPVSDKTQDTEFMAQTTKMQESTEESTDSRKSSDHTAIGHEGNDLESIVRGFLDDIYSRHELLCKKATEIGVISQEMIAHDSTDHDTVSQGTLDPEITDKQVIENDTVYLGPKTDKAAIGKELLNDHGAVQPDIADQPWTKLNQQAGDRKFTDQELANQELANLESNEGDNFDAASFGQDTANERTAKDKLLDQEPIGEQRSIDHQFMTQLPPGQHATDQVTFDQDITNEGSIYDELVDQEPISEQRFIDHQFMTQLPPGQHATDQVTVSTTFAYLISQVLVCMDFLSAYDDRSWSSHRIWLLK
eukprot:Seg708.5 transcript_id=Seg708.5/GoldUCD/mRNA.D3Y31 product="hypothetical protein" protein_id=Seg708.5/GoldUCD/D3Y31